MGILEFLKTKKDDKEIKKQINNRLKKIRNKSLKKTIKQEILHEDFFDAIFRINLTKNNAKRKKLIRKAEALASKIPEFKGWPNGSKFWDVEALSWTENIPKQVREFIANELKSSIKKGANLSLGSGSHPYIKNTILLDFSEEMLKNSSKERKDKICFNLNTKPFPFALNSFDSVTAVFVINYLKNLKDVLKEIKRILKPKGKLIIVQSAKPVSELYRIKEKKLWKSEDVEKLLKKLKFKTKIKNKKISKTSLVFISAVKK